MKKSMQDYNNQNDTVNEIADLFQDTDDANSGENKKALHTKSHEPTHQGQDDKLENQDTIKLLENRVISLIDLKEQ